MIINNIKKYSFLKFYCTFVLKISTMKKVLFSLFLFVSFLSLYAQSDSLKDREKSKIFASIGSVFLHNLNEKSSPTTSFFVNSALIGYSHSFSDKISGTIMFDVTRTTHFSFLDTIGISSYFEGSKYTAYLKVGEIKWKIHPKLELSMGQLQNEQYLTLQDKHWKRRYIATTFQEYYRFGMPADFGVRVRFLPFDNFKISLNVFNGEGPFRHQDKKSSFLYATNIEYNPHKNMILKVYADVQQPHENKNRYRGVLSGFLGYENEKWLAGLEYSKVFNNSFQEYSDLSGMSLYGVYKFKEKWAVLARIDYMNEYHGVEKEVFVLGGVEYCPIRNFRISTNFRRNTWLNTSQISLNAKISF